MLSESAFYFRSSASCGVIRVEWGMYQLGAVGRSSIGLCPELIWVQLQGTMGRWRMPVVLRTHAVRPFLLRSPHTISSELASPLRLFGGVAIDRCDNVKGSVNV